MDTRTPDTNRLELTRIPGQYGPVVRCRGILNQATAEQFRQAVSILIPMRHHAILLDLSGLRQVDSTGLAALRALLEACAPERVRPVLITGTGAAAEAVTLLGLDRQVIAVPSEAEALDALCFLFGEVQWPSRSWNEAERETLHVWYHFRTELDQLPPEELARRMTSMFPVCERSEELIQLHDHPGEERCTACPVFNATSRTREHLGCGHTLQPVLDALARNELTAAREGMDRMIAQLERLVEHTARPEAGGSLAPLPPAAKGSPCRACVGGENHA